ncbi:ABC transporter permease [Spiroplasma endosymbiont of Atherix ibis]|uniref:ABC transporter permease n=1 Tax=Spiroplasma endosymbiont of Atherix ibis TaxID=3066291 RepID=UPI0030D6001C
MLLFKNGLRKLLKDYVQFGIYLILITISVVFTSTFGIVSSNLVKKNNEINRNYEKFDYSFRYTSSAYKSNDTQTFTPWFSFNIELIENQKGNYFPTLTFGDKGVLKNYTFTKSCKNNKTQCYESSYIKDGNKEFINFHFGDVESKLSSDKPKSFMPTPEKAILNYTQEQKINTVKKAEFGDLFRFNLNSDNFKKSLIGKLYEKYNNFDNQKLSKEAQKAALNIFNYMFYLNNSVITDSIKLDLLDFMKNNDNNPEDYFKNKTLGEIDQKTGNYKFTNNPIKVDSKKTWNNEEINLFSSNASFYINKFDNKNIFYTKLNNNGYIILDNHLIYGNWFSTYFNLLGDLTNFKIRSSNEAVKWDSAGKKYRYISSFYNTNVIGSNKKETHFYNEDIFKIYTRTYNEDSLTENSFLTSSGYAKYNEMQLGKTYNIFPGSDKKYVMDGIAVDSLNIYPTIYEEDLLTNQENEAIYYISSIIFSKQFNQEGEEKSYQDVSRTYLTYNKKPKKHKKHINEMKEDINLFQTYLADNISNLNKIKESINSGNKAEKLSRAKFQGYVDTKVLNMRNSLFTGVVKTFVYLAIIFCIIFALSLCFVVYNIFKKILISQRSQIGNLKSLGVSNSKIIFNYILYMVFPIIFLVPIGWTISLFLQISLMNIFERYFNIPSSFSINWQLLLLEWLFFIVIISALVFITSYFTVKQNPLVLLQPSKSHKPNLFISKFFSKIKINNFTSKLRLIIISSAVKDLTIFFLILFFSSSVITTASLAPNTLKKMRNEYYRNIKYNNDFSYSGIIANNPLTRYSFYQMDENDKAQSNLHASVFNPLIGVEKEYKDLYDYKYWSSEKIKKTEFRKNFENIVYNNILTFKGGTLSAGIMDQMVGISNKVDSSSKLVKTTFDNFSCKVIPQLFGQSAITEESDYNSCIKTTSNNILPSTIKELWDKDDNEFKNFTFNFSNISVDKDKDEMYTRFNSKVDNLKNTPVTIYGLNLDSNLNNLIIKNNEKIKYNDSLDYIPVLINKKAVLEGLKLGDEFNLNTASQFLSTVDQNNQLNVLSSDSWKYQNDNLYSMDLSRFTYLNNKNNNLYFKKSNNEYSKYYNMANIELHIKKSLIDKNLFEKVNKEYKEYSNIQNVYTESSDWQYYIVKPFNIYTYEDDGTEKEIGLETLIMGRTNNWFNIALKNKLLTNKLVDLKNYKKIKVVGIEKLYDGNKIYMDQLYANKLMGISEGFNIRKTFDDGSSINIWSNAKMSSNVQNADQMQRIILNSFNGNNSTLGFDKYMDQAIGFTDYIDTKKIAMNNLITSIVSLSIIFISLSLITAIIIIYLITDMFVGRYKRFMSYMRIQGYSMKEINSIMLWIFLPITIIAVIVGILSILSQIFLIIPKVLLSINIAVPMIIGWEVIPIIFASGIIIFLLGYIVVMLSIKRTKLSLLIGNE